MVNYWTSMKINNPFRFIWTLVNWPIKSSYVAMGWICGCFRDLFSVKAIYCVLVKQEELNAQEFFKTFSKDEAKSDIFFYGEDNTPVSI